MPTAVVQSLSVAANAKSAQQLTTFSEERLAGAAALAYYCRSAVIGLNVTLTAGSRILLDDMPTNAVAGTAIDVSTDQVLNDVAEGGEKLQLTFRNTTGSAIVTQGMLVVTYL